MKNIIHFSHGDSYGASSAALRIHKHYKKNGFNSLFFCKKKKTNDDNNVIEINFKFKDLFFRLVSWIEKKLNLFKREYYFFDKNRNILNDIAQIEKYITINPDIIILHWISGFIDLKVIKQLKEKYNCKVYWYLMDMGPMTGGCHYSNNCSGYNRDCLNCPAVSLNYKNLPSDNLNYKKKMIKDINIEPISASIWINKQLRLSQAFKQKRIHEIMLGINSDIFKPLSEEEILNIKLKYSLPTSKKIIFFGAHSLTEKRKGLYYLIESLKLLTKNNSINSETAIIVTAGKAVSENIFKNITLPHKHIGYLNGDDELAKAYQLATVYVCASTEDSGPMMINESIMCGTPVVSFKMGVAEDLVLNAETGYIAELKNIKDLANGIFKVINLDNQKYNEMKKKCREIGLKKCSSRVQINKLISLVQNKNGIL